MTDYREKLLEKIAMGELDAYEVVVMFAKWMSNEDVRECMEDNEIYLTEEEDS